MTETGALAHRLAELERRSRERDERERVNGRNAVMALLGIISSLIGVIWFYRAVIFQGGL